MTDASRSPQTAERDDVVMGGTTEAEAATTSPPKPFLNHPLELLPTKILQAYPEGNPSLTKQSSEQAAAFERRKTDAMRKMTMSELQARYKEVAGQINERLEDNERKQQDWEAERDKKVQAHEMEVKMLKRMLLAPQED